ncbi:hypothetical protein [Octadecabacter algicola]|uniref:hypothetical protein n=1 Tax=Octadecabacter algicola TaxID=2909342 RepID=UPI001F2544C7|nr:hypothetical protein [Octadecabacter algicola]
MLALCLGGLIFVFYYLVRRPALMEYETTGKALPPIVAIACSLVLGYGLAMLWWLITHTKGQIRETFRPTLGRIVGMIALTLATPIGVVSDLPWTVGRLIALVLPTMSLAGFTFLLGLLTITYGLSAMIVRHTYERRLMRFGLFCLTFWAAYSCHLLYSGVVVFRI